MRIYSEMECDIGCEDGYFCEYYNEETKIIVPSGWTNQAVSLGDIFGQFYLKAFLC